MERNLAKQLKDAGYPQKGDRVNDVVSMDEDGTRLYFPCKYDLMSELGIELGHWYYDEANKIWKANKKLRDKYLREPLITETGQTLDEALGKLWLTLHRNKVADLDI